MTSKYKTSRTNNKIVQFLNYWLFIKQNKTKQNKTKQNKTKQTKPLPIEQIV